MRAQTSAPPTAGPPQAPGTRDGAAPPARDFGRLLVGLVVVALGAIFLLDAAGGAAGGSHDRPRAPLAIVAVGS